ncbi:hypothetical protein GCM10018777_70290 [Streptomyces albogriseolus]|nr:hypothetical protein GCM10018777_70290 [Streptomyces viridodiastaticus]
MSAEGSAYYTRRLFPLKPWLAARIEDPAVFRPTAALRAAAAGSAITPVLVHG